MIQIKRSPCPSVLEGNPASGKHYNKQEVVNALFEMQHKKCCYCEQKIPQEGHSKAVEHFRPKDSYPRLKNNWENLLLACSMCNGKKRNYFPMDSQDNPYIIDPSNPDIDPEDYLDFIVNDEDPLCGMIYSKNNSELGEKTIKVIGLYRDFYKKKRANYLRVLYPNYLEIVLADDDISKRASIRKFESLMGANSEFAAFARKFAKEKKLNEIHGVKIPVGSEIPNSG